MHKLIVIVMTWSLMGVIGALILAPIALRVESHLPKRADMIIVLGGEQGDRTWTAVELYAARKSTKVLVTGTNDSTIIATRLQLAGIPSSAILTEPNSRTTWENARYSLAQIQSNATKTAILVTSWPHSRRALATFRTVHRNITFYSAPAGDLSTNILPQPQDWCPVILEYGKIIRYLILGKIGWRELLPPSPA